MQHPFRLVGNWPNPFWELGRRLPVLQAPRQVFRLCILYLAFQEKGSDRFDDYWHQEILTYTFWMEWGGPVSSRHSTITLREASEMRRVLIQP